MEKLHKAEVLDLSKVKPDGKFNFQEAIAEAQIDRFLAEEAEVTEASEEIAKLKEKTQALLVRQQELRELGDEEMRRELRNEVVVLNMRLVTQILKKYGYFSQDKFQNGCVGLLKAAETYNIEKEVPFVNYAAYCIEMEIRVAWKKQTRAFESKHKGFLDSIDEPMTLGNGDSLDRGEMIEDEGATMDFTDIVEQSGLDTLMYEIILPAIEEYGVTGKNLDVVKWRELELQYFLEMAVEESRLKRLTFTQMAKELGTTTQNLRYRHNKVMELIRTKCEEYGFVVGVYGGIYYDDGESYVKPRNRRSQRNKNFMKGFGIYDN